MGVLFGLIVGKVGFGWRMLFWIIFLSCIYCMGFMFCMIIFYEKMILSWLMCIEIWGLWGWCFWLVGLRFWRCWVIWMELIWNICIIFVMGIRIWVMLRRMFFGWGVRRGFLCIGLWMSMYFNFFFENFLLFLCL